jgi:hypothetical protein
MTEIRRIYLFKFCYPIPGFWRPVSKNGVFLYLLENNGAFSKISPSNHEKM